ncbi:Sporulation protein YtfJ (Spore_YtfJ) [uncultured archaeon]|nr:Sporulation protein YtfJ (Spore_YtfJ) [uncultured archaeon]
MPAEDAIKTAIDELLKSLSTSNIAGEPIELEDKFIIPIAKMGMGFGAGECRRGSEPEKSPGGGAGGGVGVFPVAVVVVFKGIPGPEGVKVIPLSLPAEPIANAAHAIMEKITGHKRRPADTKSIQIE